ncbi:NfeD family protein [Halalkalibacter oceani]|uniref:Nodulation protein NfeD n=1 Tax=Halalkalibacter oceani TaxID=1653776 RepID=A0A9X2DPU5_9BACI|nr:NfeD family protein [Halalkalibacter oceani]MCM3712873.1 nodulation protein NfeD [Halalkalibacter oceani]
MEWLDSASIGFLVVFLGTLFLIGELLVRAKGLFALLGIAIMAMYFSYHLSGEVGFWVVILYVVGLALIIIDGKVITDGTVALLGIILMIIGLAVPAPTFLYGVFVSMGFLLGGFGSALFLKVFPSRNLWAKMTLKDRLTGDLGYNSINESYTSLVGKEGKTLTPFRPTGSIEIDGAQYSATSGGQWIEAGAPIEVVSVDGTRIVVKKREENKESE